MSKHPLARSVRRDALLGAIVTAVVVAGRADLVPAQTAHDALAMTDAKMDAWVNDWYQKHPRRGVDGEDTPVATFTATGRIWNADGNAGTPIDTVSIWVGQTVRWQLGDGSHTTTNGTGSSDPQAGLLWDQPIHTLAQSFQFTFTNAGTFPFFCRTHEVFSMRGVVIVRAVSDVEPVTRLADRTGFVTDPWPNPVSSTVGIRFAMQKPGRARLTVYDARGRLVAIPFDRDLDAGTWAGGWDRRTRTGEPAVAGVYFLKLEVTGHVDSRRIVVNR